MICRRAVGTKWDIVLSHATALSSAQALILRGRKMSHCVEHDVYRECNDVCPGHSPYLRTVNCFRI